MAKQMSGGEPLWYHNPNPTPKCCEQSVGRAKAFLLERLYQSITQHDIVECYKLLRLLPKELALDSNILFRFVMILVNSVDTDEVNKNFLIYLESFLAKLDLSKPEAFIEFLAYFIRNNRLEDAKELMSRRQRFMGNPRHRPVPFVDLSICCYKFFINYSEWSQRSQNKNIMFDYSIQGWLVNAMEGINKVSCNYEYFVMAILRVLLFYGFSKKAYLFASEFQRINPDNISAQLMLLKLINLLNQDESVPKKEGDTDALPANTEATRLDKRLNDLSSINNFHPDDMSEVFVADEYPIATDRCQILENLVRLDKRRLEILELSVDKQDQTEGLKLIMDSLEYKDEIKNIARWQSLQDILCEIISSDDTDLFKDARDLWQIRYQQFWDLEYFLQIVEDDAPCREYIGNVLQLLSENFGNPELTYEVVEEHNLMDID